MMLIRLASTIILVLTLFEKTNSQEACGRRRVCKCWKTTRKYIVNCSNRSLSVIPAHIPTYVTDLINFYLSMKIVLSQRITFLVTFAVVLGQTYALSTNACVVCNCSQEETMYVVNCSQKMFEEVPKFIPSNVGYLLLSHNHLTKFPQRLFDAMLELQILDLSHNNLKELPARIFENNRMLSNLSLCRNNLTEIPEDLFTSVEDLQFLDLSNNYLEKLPPRLFENNSMLSDLRLSYNQLKELPQDLFENNANLTKLDVANNHLTKIPSRLLEATAQLKYLSLCGNNLTEIPEDLFTRVEDLQFLTLCRNNITSIDKTALNGSMDLQLLDLTTNKLSSLPKDLFSGVNLGKALDLSENEIEEIPDGLFCSNKVHYHNLTWLLIRNNKLVSLTKTSFKGLRYLTHIFLNGNNIEKLGDSVFEGTSVQFIYIFSNKLTKISSKSFNTEFLQEIQIYKNRIKTISADDFDTRLGSILIYLHCYDLEKIPTLSSQVEATCITGDFVPKIAVNAKSTVAQFGINLEEDGFNCSFHDLKPECTPCLPGTYDDGTNECRSCPAGGYFQDDFGLMDCKVCKKGTFVKSPGGKSVQDCELCPEGTDLARHAGHRACFCKMNYARVGRFQPCSLCLEEGLNCSKDFKSLQPGYYWNWSFPGANLTAYSNFVLHLENDSPNYNLSSKQYRQLIPKVHGCPLRDSCENKGSYMAGNITGNCKHGYRGWLCSKCQNSFYSIRNTCIKCPDKKWIILETIVILSLGIGLYVFMTWQNRRHGNCDKNERSLVDKVSSQMKIALGFYQVIGELFESFHDIPWIGPLKFLEQLISFLKLNVFRLFFRPHCYSEKLKINIKIQFILSLSFPFVMFFLFASFYHVWKLYLRYKFRNATIQTFKKLKKLREKLYTYILILLFITYPPTCDVIFKLYPDACKTFFIYENDTTVNITLLRSDFDLDCKSLKIYQFYAFIATVVYVASFPCLLLMILKTYSKKIVTTQANGEQFSNNQYEPGTAMNDGAHLINETREHIRIPVWIKFLCENYKPQYWYWEIIELTRKVTQTILVTLLGWENTLTKLLTIGISVLFLTLHARLSPMTSAFEQRLQMFSLSAIFINVLIAAVPIPQIYRAPLATILILMNMIIILVIAGEIALFIFRVVKGQMTRKQEER